MFSKVEVKPKYKNNLSPWLTKVIKRFSGRKQSLYEKFLKNRIFKNEHNYKT